MLSVKNNLMSENTARHLRNAYSSLSTSVERLSSGLRVSSAKDDAAGMAVRELLRADIAVLDQAVRNANDGISMLQAAEGALQVVDNIIVRMSQLAEQAATGTYSASQRGLMDQEYQELILEIDRIANSTDFNDIFMINAATAITIHLGEAATAISVTGADLTSTGLGLAGTDISTAANADAAVGLLQTAVETKDSTRAAFGYYMNRLESAIQVLEVQKENLQAAESRISDVDVASEMATFTRNQVLAQAGVSMLSQANGIPQMALQLLQQ
jgi:flagellin